MVDALAISSVIFAGQVDGSAVIGGAIGADVGSEKESTRVSGGAKVIVREDDGYSEHSDNGKHKGQHKNKHKNKHENGRDD